MGEHAARALPSVLSERPNFEHLSACLYACSACAAGHFDGPPFFIFKGKSASSSGRAGGAGPLHARLLKHVPAHAVLARGCAVTPARDHRADGRARIATAAIQRAAACDAWPRLAARQVVAAGRAAAR